MNIFIIISLFFHLLLPAPEGNQREMEALRQWRAEEIVSAKSIEIFGKENIWRAEPISEQIFARMKGRSYKDNCTLPLDSLRYLKLLHYDAEGNIRLGEMVCHKAVSESLIAIFKELYEAPYGTDLCWIYNQDLLVGFFDLNAEKEVKLVLGVVTVLVNLLYFVSGLALVLLCVCLIVGSVCLG